jgi:hypothetical protein
MYALSHFAKHSIQRKLLPREEYAHDSPPFHRNSGAEIGLDGILAAQPFHAHPISTGLSKELKIALVGSETANRFP